MMPLVIIVYLECLKGMEENSLSACQLDKFKMYCTAFINSNLKSSFKELCDSCSAILKFMVESPEKELPAMQFI